MVFKRPGTDWHVRICLGGELVVMMSHSQWEKCQPRSSKKGSSLFSKKGQEKMEKRDREREINKH